MLVDVSRQIEPGAVYRLGTPPVELKMEHCFHEDEGGQYETATLFMPLHTATHIDVVKLDNVIEPWRFIGPGKLIDVTGITERQIQPADCRGREGVKEGDFVFFRTGWDKFTGSPAYFRHPELSEETVDWLIEMKVNMVGIDALGLGVGKRHGNCDRKLTTHGIYVIENLANLSAITAPSFTVYCFPLKIAGVDAIPARVVVEL